MHFVQLKQKFLVSFPHHTNNSLRRIIKYDYFRELFIRPRHFEYTSFNYDVLLNVMDISVGVGAFVIELGQISSFLSLHFPKFKAGPL